MSELADPDSLPPAHPHFAAHFTSKFYDADDYENDDQPPFGNDEGWDEVHDWAERLDELLSHPTLRHMLGENADGQIEELRHTDQVDVDDILIGQGFTLLRFTGQIDPEGRAWLLEALQRQDERSRGEEYETMIEDLASFGDGAATSDPQESPPHRSTPPQQQRSKAWLTIIGMDIPGMNAWLKRTAAAISADPAWQDWWSSADVAYLRLYPLPVGPPGRDELRFHRKPSSLEVLGSSQDLTKTLKKFAKKNPGPDTPPLADLLNTPNFIPHIEGLILRLLQHTATHLKLTNPPAHLPPDR